MFAAFRMKRKTRARQESAAFVICSCYPFGLNDLARTRKHRCALLRRPYVFPSRRQAVMRLHGKSQTLIHTEIECFEYVYFSFFVDFFSRFLLLEFMKTSIAFDHRQQQPNDGGKCKRCILRWKNKTEK